MKDVSDLCFGFTPEISDAAPLPGQLLKLFIKLL